MGTRIAAPQRPYSGWRSQHTTATVPPSPRRNWRRFFRLLAVAFFRVLAVLLGVGIAGVLYTVPILAVSRVEVSGNDHLSREAVLVLADVAGRNLLALDLPAAQARLLTNPWVRRATVQRQLPATVAISIEERAPIAMWQTGSDRYLMADDGVLLEPGPLVTDLPTILDQDSAPQEIGGTVPARPASLAQALRREFPQDGEDRVVAFEYRATLGFTVVTAGGLRVAFGDGRDLPYQLATFRQLLAEARQTGLKITEIDVRFGARPVLRTEQPQPETRPPS